MAVQSEEKDLPEPILEQAKLRVDFWMKSLVTGLVAVALPVSLGLTKDHDDFTDPNDDEGWNTDTLLQVAVPTFILWLVVAAASSRVTTLLGFDMIAEASLDHSFKESVRTNMTNNGIILALLLGCQITMLQTESAIEQPYTRNSCWFMVLAGLGIEGCLRGFVMVGFFLLYCEPLNEDASKQFVVDNMLYLGEPITCVITTGIYFVMCLLIWSFMALGKYIGIAVAIVFACGVTRCMVVLQYLSRWENPQLQDHHRKGRSEVLKIARSFDGTQA